MTARARDATCRAANPSVVGYAMLIAARYLVDRLRHPRSRAAEVLAVRSRLAAAPGPGEASAAELEAAVRLLGLREALSKALGEVSSCSGCARGHPLPNGHWNGGHCCGGRTEEIWSDVEVAALRLSGTTPGRLTPPVSDHAGCAFRGPEGCSLAVADRPNLCVRYLCLELEGELRERGDLPKIKALAAEIRETLARFARLREARLEEAGEAP